MEEPFTVYSYCDGDEVWNVGGGHAWRQRSQRPGLNTAEAAVVVDAGAPRLLRLLVMTDEAHQVGVVHKEHGAGRMRGYDGDRVAGGGV